MLQITLNGIVYCNDLYTADNVADSAKLLFKHRMMNKGVFSDGSNQIKLVCPNKTKFICSLTIKHTRDFTIKIGIYIQLIELL